MTDTAPAAPRDSQRTSSRVRIGLTVVLIVLILMLLALGYAIVKVVQPTVGSNTTPAVNASGLEWVRSMYSYGPGDDQRLDSPVSVAVANDGTIYGVDTQTNMVMAFNPDGSVRAAVSLVEASGSQAGHLGPKSVMVAENGDVYVGANVAEAVYVLTEDLEYLRSFVIQAIPYCMVEDGDSLLVSTEEGILRFSTEGEFIGVFAPRGLEDGQVNLAQAMEFTDDGVLCVADSMSGRIQAFDREGALLWKTSFGSVLTDDVRPSTEASNTSGFQVPSGLTIDGNGRLVVADMQMMEIFVLDAESGATIARFGEFGYSDGDMTYPMGIAYDRSRDWFVLADMGNSRLQILRIPDSAPASIAAAARRGLVGPAWVCCIPLLLLLVLLASMLLRHRRSKTQTEEPTAEGIQP